ncbi:cysteine hydrolase [bacterium]|nr:cysteine hydrolase [bacterium]
MITILPDVDAFLTAHKAFFEYIADWERGLGPLLMDDLTDHGKNGRKIVVLCVDLIKGFVSHGPLASPRIAAIVPNVVDLFRTAYARGVRDFVLAQDSHPPDSPQFEAFGAHCVVGTGEAETIDELAGLPFSNEFTVMLKQSLDPAIDTDLDVWMDQRQNITSVIIVGDCTDLCVYQTAMHIRMRANAMPRNLDVIVPANCVQTYDVSVADAPALCATPHDADLLHVLFLHHMFLNGIIVAKEIKS